jgi:uncharacterized RDD family membrane protein YckC
MASPGAARGRNAGLISRAAADVVDLVVAVVLSAILLLAFEGIRFVLRPRNFQWRVPATGAALFVSGVFLLYLTFAWSAAGRSFGKQMMGLRVQHGDAALRLGRSFLRAFLCVAFPIGLLWCAVDRRNRSLWDLVFSTRVVYDWRPRVPVGRPAIG